MEFNMLKKEMTVPCLTLLLGGLLLSLAPGYYDNYYPPSHNPRNMKPFIAEGYYITPGAENPAVKIEPERLDERDWDIHQRGVRLGNWGTKQNWRFDRGAFYSGQTQGEAYLHEHPYGVGGIGMYPDYEYLQMESYFEQEKRNRQYQDEQSRQNDSRNYR